jgi:hypothetical protein
VHHGEKTRKLIKHQFSLDNHLTRVVFACAKDGELFQHLEELGVEPQLYGMRWIRLLLGREFHMEDVLVCAGSTL